MSDPIATADDLALFRGQPVDDDRADFLIGLAQEACEEFVLPLPASAKRIVLAVTARVYNNPDQVATEALGPYSAGRPPIDLTRQERASLRRIAGRGGAGSTSVLSQGGNAVQTVIVAATAGTFTLALDGQVTSALAFNASAADVQAALAALPGVGVGNVTVAGAYTVTFVNDRGNQPVSTLVADGTSLTGSASVAVVASGVAVPGSNLPGWEYDYSNRSWLA